MLLLLLLTSAFLLVPWAGAGRIIGGREAKAHSWPYIAHISIENETHKATCGGFLIRQDAVLSAAHCVPHKMELKVTVTLGAHHINRIEWKQQKFHIKHWVIHPNYSEVTNVNDIMLLKLNPGAKLTKEVSAIPLPSLNEHVLPGAICKVAGWGWTSIPGKTSSVLMEVDVKVQREEECVKSFQRNYLRQSMICAGDEDGEKSISNGDSGGPLVCNGKAHGIVSYQPKYCIFPEVYTRVSYFESWINQELKKFARKDLPVPPASE